MWASVYRRGGDGDKRVRKRESAMFVHADGVWRRTLKVSDCEPASADADFAN